MKKLNKHGYINETSYKVNEFYREKERKENIKCNI